jgi:uncharacterized metal-binding protein YceD (DUF177 family)
MEERAVLRLGDLGGRPRGVAFEPGEAERSRMAVALGLEALPSLRLFGRLEPEGREDWRLDARLEAVAVQACVVTLEPVETAVAEPVERLYVAGLAEPEEAEVEMPDETREPLPAALDLRALAEEALALALPPFPRAPGAELGEAVFAAPGVEPLTDEAARPFAGLAGLRKRMDEG